MMDNQPMPNLTCGECRHFEKKSNPMDLSAKQGECLEGPPRAIPAGNGMMAFFYPVLGADFKACHRFEPRSLALTEDVGK